MNILLFAGTTEGRELADRLLSLPVAATICVATEYGGELLRDFSGRFTVLTGRLNEEAIVSLLKKTPYDFVVDATHPYAVAVSANIRAACDAASTPRLRLLRGESLKSECLYVESAKAAAEALTTTVGNILLTTGTKELSAFTVVPEFAERMYPRILPAAESVGECATLGFKRSHIIAMQGPFSRELNLAVMRQYAIRVMVTKDGGVEGGFPEKMLAASEAEVGVVVIGRPLEKEGVGLDEIFAIIGSKLEAGQ